MNQIDLVDSMLEQVVTMVADNFFKGAVVLAANPVSCVGNVNIENSSIGVQQEQQQ